MSSIASSKQNLRLLDLTSATRELDLASELFHRINRVIPVNQEILSVRPDCTARDAVSLMQKHGYSQLPIISEGEVLGVFSFRSFAKATASGDLSHWNTQRCAPG